MENSSVMTASNSVSGDSSSGPPQQQQPAAPPPAPVKKKRNLPGMPDPEAEVIALSPKTLLATNRFVCEICNKGFQRDQNLQLHRRGHNLPWKLRQRNGKEVRKRVYVCPEPSCVHHDPARALGDLTGIKKHFCRKHGEKKWKCDKCSKKYAVQSDWKAHAKTCGTREYRCDCGTLFSRRDSFITHRAFCDALAEESAKSHTNNPAPEEQPKMAAAVAAEETKMAAPAPVQQVAPAEQQEPEAAPAAILQYLPPPPPPPSVAVNTSGASASSCVSSSSSTSSTSLFASLFASAGSGAGPVTGQGVAFSDLIGAVGRAADREPPSLCLSTSGPVSLFGPAPPPPERRQYAPAPPSPHMSATALLQKAAQMGAAATNASLLRGFGLASTTTTQESIQQDSSLQWHPHHQQQPLEPEPPMLSAGLGLGLSYENSGNGLPELMMGPPSMFMSKPATLDFLGLGMGPGGTASGGLSALITSIGGGLDMGAPSPGPFGGGSGSSPGKGWEGPERKPSGPAIL